MDFGHSQFFRGHRIYIFRFTFVAGMIEFEKDFRRRYNARGNLTGERIARYLTTWRHPRP